jgi:hypothetical protein
MAKKEEENICFVMLFHFIQLVKYCGTNHVVFFTEKKSVTFPSFCAFVNIFFVFVNKFFLLNNEGRKVTLYCIALIQSFLNGKPF